MSDTGDLSNMMKAIVEDIKKLEEEGKGGGSDHGGDSDDEDTGTLEVRRRSITVYRTSNASTSVRTEPY